ncbi:MAG TPA: GLPGLI family protein, partial [Rikenellaceae bacterium]|nr:GLPGLI family protein [Rikenellaceae bacterium]
MLKNLTMAMIVAVAMPSGIEAEAQTAEQKNSGIECIYEYKVTNPKGVTDTYSTILQFDRQTAKFYDYSTFQLDSVSQSKGATKEQIDEYRIKEMRNDYFLDQAVLQNEPKGNITVYSVITPDNYTYTESLPNIHWTLTEETGTICGYTCKKATGEYGGRSWTVWYTPDIPVTFGPWKLCGLPGLVMSATDSEGIHHFEAIVIRKGTTPITENNATNVISTTREKFIKSKNHFEENPMQNLPVEAISEMSI